MYALLETNGGIRITKHHQLGNFKKVAAVKKCPPEVELHNYINEKKQKRQQIWVDLLF